ncbi:MAG: rhomboid family intramembrane serine protease [Spirochaetaceae bacterium]|nr:rhomboid family intramembrane serine protease [Spirochaetaceae bacterium]
MNQFGSRRSVTFILIGINVAVFFLLYLMPGLIEFLAIYTAGLLGRGFIWTPITYMFTHAGFIHLFFNMIILVFAGPVLEERMGSREFLTYYLVTGALAGIFSVFAYKAAGSGDYLPIIGASGALYAVMLAFATYNPRARILIWGIIPMKAPYFLALYAAIDLYSHVFGRGGNIAHLTHLSGLAFGFLYFMIRLKINPIKVMRDGR